MYHWAVNGFGQFVVFYMLGFLQTVYYKHALIAFKVRHSRTCPKVEPLILCILGSLTHTIRSV